MCFFLGGLRFHEQRFNKTAASTMSTLMAVSTGALMIPTALHAALQANVQVEDGEVHSILLRLSRGTSMVMLFLYVMYLFFQLRSHGDMFSGSANESDHVDTPALTVWEASFVLLVVTLLVSVCANYLVGSIEGLVETTGISKTFVGIILIPIIGNAVEHTTAIIVAMKDKVIWFIPFRHRL